jgi:hypothetical protein
VSRFFRKYSMVFLFFSLFSVEGNGQVLTNANLNLNSGGYINDAIYDPYHDCYIVVGNFTTINGISKKNLAFLDKTTLAVLSPSYLNPYTNIDGEIRTVAITKTDHTDNDKYHLYLGGNFSTITIGVTNYTRIGIVKFVATHSHLSINPGNFLINPWNPDLDLDPLFTGYESPAVNDILITNDTVIFAGSFFGVNDNGIAGPYSPRDGIAAYTVGGTLLNYPYYSVNGVGLGCLFFYLYKDGPYLYVSGRKDIYSAGVYKGDILKLDATGTEIASFNTGIANLRTVFKIQEIDDSLLCISLDLDADDWGPDQFRIISKQTGATITSHSLNSSSGIGGVSGFDDFDLYFNTLYFSTSSSVTSIGSFENGGIGPPLVGTLWSPAATTNLNENAFGKVHVAGNKLFVSSNNLLSLSGQSRLRLGAYCLEPHKAEYFVTYDTTICPEQATTYAIPQVPFADGYLWEYTGVGEDFLADLSYETAPLDISLTTAYSIQISFGSSFTPGQLKVTPYSLCNGATKIYGNTVSINIQLNPLPHVNAGLDKVLTCANDTLAIYGYSDSSVISYEWVYPDIFDNVSGQYDTIEDPGNYVFKVVNALGCPNYDTLTISENIAQPTATLPPPPYELTCLNPVVDFLGTSSTPNTISHWYQVSSATFPNPISVNAIGTYYFRVTDTLNGCFKDDGIVVSNNITPPDIEILGYPTIGLTLETLTCDLDTLNLTCTSPTLNTTTSWINADTTVFYGDQLTITEGGIYHLFATNNTNGCTNYLSVFVLENFSLPGMTVPADGLLNCSTDSIILSASSLDSATVLEWTGSTIPSSPNPLTVYDAGWYYLSAENLANGCKTIDSVLVSQDNSITVFAGNDTLVCDNETVPLNASYLGTISGINYLWSNGTTNANTSYTAGTQPYAIVQITGDGGCVGTDTVYLNLPPIPVITFEGFKPCDDGPSGQIVASPVSGMEPFTYSIDNGINYQASSVFNDLYIGDYPILVRDSINCEYSYMATIDENSSLPSPAFLFSTYNFETDTVVLIDVSNPPTDSTFWLFPTELIVLDNNPLSPMILLPDTGTFQITMQAYYGTCLVELSKLIYASPFDSLAATQYNLNGIKSIELYPNPTTGNFTVEVEFYKSQRAALVVQDMLANTYVFEEYDESFTIAQDIYLDGTVIDGSYVLKIVSEFDSASITFILAR